MNLKIKANLSAFLEKLEIRESRLVLVLPLFFLAFYNNSFFSHVLEVYPLSWANLLNLLSLSIVLFSVIGLFFTLTFVKYSTKALCVFMLFSASAAGYFMDNFNIIIDMDMYQNIFRTSLHESQDLFSPKLLVSLFFLGVLPSLLICKLKIRRYSFKRTLLSKLKLTAILLIMIVVQLFSFNKFYASFFREHKSLRYYTNPTYLTYSGVKYLSSFFELEPLEFQQIGLDAKILPKNGRKNLMIFVAGETARADRFSLNGYFRETNPMLKKENMINFPEFYSSFTSTARSLPCMFSVYTKDEYTNRKGKAIENLLDVFTHAGVKVLWRENNTGSQNVADRVTYEDYTDPKVNTICDVECRDEGMLVGLQDYIDKNSQDNIFIVLHQIGNHGPAYYKRYPKEFEKFKPTKATSQLNECSSEEINNAYDNAILYTDYFLSKVISLLKANQDKFNASMFYSSDHGESLGENGVYLHGLPNFMAPKSQKHVAALMWIGKDHFIERESISSVANLPYSHDYIFHTTLGFMGVETEVYSRKLDISKAHL